MRAEPMRRLPERSRRALLVAVVLGSCLALPLHAAEAPCAVPTTIDDGWERADPEASGFDANALCDAIRDAAKGEINIHGIVVERHGRLVAELYRRGKDKPMSSLFAREVEFGPTDLHDMRSISKSVVSLLVGVAIGQRRIAAVSFAGLRLRPRDLAKIGRMVLDHGQWHGRQVVPASWVAASLAEHIPTGDGRQYGYQWWVGRAEWRGKVMPWSGAIGNGGQRLYVLPELDMAVVITAGEYNSADIGQKLGRLMARIAAAVQ
jgi:CubicO group peptidase (beta-lactamase class C family)